MLIYDINATSPKRKKYGSRARAINTWSGPVARADERRRRVDESGAGDFRDTLPRRSAKGVRGLVTETG
ncbi:hypothetical protein EVAR_102862_1 [Eumeta japonica]|uniref:Uncharacterized protein n=1 Tax=Eumeta variegata TaxID=151549 RepID=A0A4C1UMQ9_EUMVA|nr:hypothetical protein EVAR_102862_1 [Eumeta japonica]